MNPVSIECFCITGSGSKEIVAKGFRTENLNVLPKCKGVRFLILPRGVDSVCKLSFPLAFSFKEKGNPGNHVTSVTLVRTPEWLLA